MRSTPLTLILAISGFTEPKSKDSEGLTQVQPNDVTRFGFDKANGYQAVQISNEFGPQNDGMLDLIDAIKLDEDDIDVEGYDCALVVRVESTRGLDSFVAQAMGESIEAYMTANRSTEFATATVADLDVDQELHGKWNTILLLRDSTSGAWTFKNLRFTSVQKSTDGGYAVLSGNKMGKIDDGYALVSTLIDNQKLQQVLAGGFELEKGKYHLVRAPINQNGAYAVVGSGTQIVYDDKFNVIASGQTGFTVMPAIDVDGTHTDAVTTVSGKGSAWDIRRSIAPAKADSLAPAYSAAA
ncbi:hypothetical protein HY733_00540 [Candidatus Uhrbacteria bacterium]|nr:hypothetical protein [Candidatus Uhrbacteria bacterium]